MQFPRIIRGSAWYKWLTSGRTDAQNVGGRGLGIETMETFGNTADHDGTRHGMVRTPEKFVKDETASTHKFVKGGSKVRKGEVKADAQRASRPAHQRVATAPARKDGKRAARQIINAQLRHKTAERDKTKAKLRRARKKVRTRERVYRKLSRSERGYFGSFGPVFAIESFIALFDIGVIHDAMERSGTSSTTAWMTSLGVPLLVFGCNHAFGVVAGAIGLATPREKRRALAVVAFLAGMTLLIATFVALLIFRGQAGAQLNRALNALADGRNDGPLTFLVPMQWLGLAQMAGSIAAISAVALWTIAKRGREQQKRIQDVERKSAAYQGEVERLDREIADLVREGQAAELAIYEIAADEAAAHSELAVLQRQLDGHLEAEDGLCEAVQARGDIEYEITEALYRNGGVWRQAMPSVRMFFGRFYTPGPRDIQGDPPEAPRPTEPGSNGHDPSRHVDPDDFVPLS